MEFTTIKISKKMKERIDVLKAKYTLKIKRKVSGTEFLEAVFNNFDKSI